jgi:hypothetical protein
MMAVGEIRVEVADRQQLGDPVVAAGRVGSTPYARHRLAQLRWRSAMRCCFETRWLNRPENLAALSA